ncbi:MAG: RNA 2',3'-cyclic phosphodiesterase [candidate division WOR-3 bacterium]
MRTFIAVEIPEKQKKLIWDFILEHKKGNPPIKWVAFENLHITLKFLGEIDEKKINLMVSALTTISARTKSFKLKLENPGCFPSVRNPRVLWIGVTTGAQELTGLATDIENSLTQFGIKKEDKKFHPHLTIGRIKTSCRVDEIVAKIIQTEEFLINEFVLFKSTLLPSGPVYEKLKNFALV